MAGIVLGFLITGCAGLTFSYSYYGLEAASYDGKLLAVNPKDDKDLSFCRPDAGKKGKCIVMDGPEFYALKKDKLTCEQALVDCQKGGK